MRDAVRRLREHDEEGLSLVEIMVAAFILTVALLALASTATASLISLSTSLGRQEAMDAASAMIEDLRRGNFASLAMQADDPGVVALAQAHDECDPDYGEPLVMSIQEGALPLHRTFGPSDRITLRIIITWFDEEGTGSFDGNTCVKHVTYNTKRVRVLATWSDRGRDFTLEESTLVSAVERGLPAPDFRVGPTTQTLDYHIDGVPSQNERCLSHTLRNLGATDGYDWDITRTDGGDKVKADKQSTSTYQTASSSWFVRAFLEFPAGETQINPGLLETPIPTDFSSPTAPPIPDGLELLVDLNGNSWPQTSTRLDAGDQARLWICYRPGSTDRSRYHVSGDTYRSWDFEIKVRSLFDPNRFELIQHRVGVVNENLYLYLFDSFVPEPGVTVTTETASHPRVRAGDENLYPDLPPLTMGPEGTTEPDLLGTTQGLPNYDSDFSVREGMRLQDGARTQFPSEIWNASIVQFHYQVTQATRTFDPNITLRLYSRAGSTFGEGSLDPAPEQLTYRFSLEVLDASENPLVEQPPALTEAVRHITRTYTHSEPGWMVLNETFQLDGNLTIADNQYLRLTIQCMEEESTDACHIAFDHVDYRSHLELKVTG